MKRMAEEDWLRPFNRITHDHLHVVIIGIAGVWFLLGGLLGYDVGGRFSEGKGWTGHVQWWEVGIGLAALTSAFFALRRTMKQPRGRLPDSYRTSPERPEPAGTNRAISRTKREEPGPADTRRTPGNKSSLPHNAERRQARRRTSALELSGS
jgi:hypothetical protein